MKHYYTNSEIVEIYGVYRKTVPNWIEQAKLGRLELELAEVEGKSYILKTPKNQVLIKQLVQERRKYLNKRSLKTAKPVEKFYQLYNEEQILDIITNIDINREIPLQYSYFDGGAHFWDEYTQRLHDTGTPSNLTSTVELLQTSRDYLEKIMRDFKQVNVVDVGVGNALPAKDLLTHLLKTGKLGKYLAVDISDAMIDVARKNIDHWFGDKVKFEGFVNDISFEPFGDAIAEPPNDTMNLVLFLGGTLSNFRAPEEVLRVIHRSMGRNDRLIYTLKLDSPAAREQFGFLTNLQPQCKQTLDLLGIDESYYEIEVGYDQEDKSRYGRIRLKHALTIDFELPKGKWSVELNRDDTIIVWRARHNNAFDITDQFYANGFHPLLTSQTADHNYMLILADLRKNGN